MNTNSNTKNHQQLLHLVQKPDNAPSTSVGKRALSPAMQKKCNRLVKTAVSVASKKADSADPIVGKNRPLAGVIDSLIRKHGTFLPEVLAGILEESGLTVLLEESLPIYESALTLATENDYELVKNIKHGLTDKISTSYAADLVVICPLTGWVGVFDGKRGTGNSDSSSKALLGPKLTALKMTIVKIMQSRGHPVLTADVRVIDFYGRSGYRTDLKIDGCDLDNYFGLDIQNGIAEANRMFAIGSAHLQKLVAPGSDADPDAVEAGSLCDYAFPDKHTPLTKDLFTENDLSAANDIDPIHDRSLAMARHQLAAVAAAAAA